MFVVIGTTTLDLFISGVEGVPRFDGDEFTTSSLVFCGQPLTMTLGGNGANSAAVLAALGAPVALASATGTDDLGDVMAGWLGELGVDLRGLVRREAATAANTTVMDEHLNRLSFYYQGLFSTLGYEDLAPGLLADADSLLITGYPLLPGFRGGGFEAALREAKQHGAITALDIGPAIGQPATLDEIRPLLPVIDYLLTNEYELAVCTGVQDVSAGITRLMDAGATCVIVKRGPDGALIQAQGDDPITVPGFDVEANVTIGAGDSFNAGFMFGLQQGMDRAQAARFGNATAALVLRTGRSSLGAPSRAEVESLVNS